MPTRLPLVRRRCHACASERFQASGKFRVNANHKLLDAWLLVLCATCGDTAKLTLLERTNVRSIRPELLDRLHANDLGLVAELLQDPLVQHRNRISLDWDNAWRLHTGEPDRPVAVPVNTRCSGHSVTAGARTDGADHSTPEALDVTVHFAARIPVRPIRLIAEGCGLPRAEVERLITEGRIVSAVRLSGRQSADFTFTLKH